MKNKTRRTRGKESAGKRLGEACRWIRNGQRRSSVLGTLDQPLTARQVSKRTGREANNCSHALRELDDHGLVRCLNPSARRSRLYGLTRLGERCALKFGREVPRNDPFKLDWDLYGWTCYRQRTAVLTALLRSMRPPHIKRAAGLRDAGSKMSANNVRDVVRQLEERGLVKALSAGRGNRPIYRLTRTGKQIRDLLIRTGGQA